MSAAIQVRPVKIWDGEREVKGRGVFATAYFPRGALIEDCPVLVVPRLEIRKKSVLGFYVYEWSATEWAIALGCGSLYNHAYTPNAVYRFDVKRRAISIFAHCDILAGSEIRFNYNNSPYDLTPVKYRP